MTTAVLLVTRFYLAWITWLEDHLPACPTKKYLHFECPGCGLQRSVIALMKGEVSESLQLYPATIPIMLLFLFTGLHLKYKFSFGPAVIKALYITVTSIVVISYIYKIIHHQIIA
jgi:hypothetical protein